MWSVALYPLNCDHLIYSIHMFRVRLEYLFPLPGKSWYFAGISNYLVNSPWVSILLRVKLDPLWLLWKEEKDIPCWGFRAGFEWYSTWLEWTIGRTKRAAVIASHLTGSVVKHRERGGGLRDSRKSLSDINCESSDWYFFETLSREIICFLYWWLLFRLIR